MAAIIFRVLAIISIVGGLVMRLNGFPEGDSFTKLGLAVLTVSILVSFVRIPPNSRGTF